RGKRNEPERVTLVAQQIADLRDMSYEEVCRQPWRTCCSNSNANFSRYYGYGFDWYI
ncbi:hypothetical protein ACQKHK_11130, partial [Staphylococcus capitis]